MWEPTSVRELKAGDVFSRWGRIFLWDGAAGEILSTEPSAAAPVSVSGVALWPVVHNLATVVLPMPEKAMRVLRYVASPEGWTPPPPFRGPLTKPLQEGRHLGAPLQERRTAPAREKTSHARPRPTSSPSGPRYLPGDRPWQEEPWDNPLHALEARGEPRQVARRSGGQFVNADNPFPDGDRYDEDSDPTEHYS